MHRTINSVFLAAISLAAMIVALGCAGGAGTSEPAAQSQTGKLSLSLPATASWISALQAKSAGKDAARAFACADWARVSITDASGNAVMNPVCLYLTNDFSTYPGALADSSAATVSGIPAGSGYTVSIDIYNTKVSTTSPVVSGNTGGVSVSEGATTSVSITCVPVSPTALALGDEKTLSLSPRGEAWYSIAASAETSYYLTQTDGDAMLALFDASGALLASGYTEVSYAASANTTIYAVVVDWYWNTVQESGTIALASSEDALSEGEASPVELTTGSSHLFRAGPNTGANNASYYSFTTADAGDYALETTRSMYYSLTLATDQSFSAVVCQKNGTAAGALFSSLAANTKYYLRFCNNCSYRALMHGTLLGPSDLASVTLNSEGSAAAPVSLAVGTAHSGHVGYRGYDDASHYSFTAASAGDYKVSLADVSPSENGLQLQIFNDAEETDQFGYNFSIGDGSTSLSGLGAGTYYIRVLHAIYGNDDVSYTITVSQ